MKKKTDKASNAVSVILYAREVVQLLEIRERQPIFEVDPEIRTRG